MIVTWHCGLRQGSAYVPKRGTFHRVPQRNLACSSVIGCIYVRVRLPVSKFDLDISVHSVASGMLVNQPDDKSRKGGLA